MTRTLEPATTPSDADAPVPGARQALVLLLAINLFNYIDRQVLSAVEPLIAADFHVSQARMGLLATAFFVSYMATSPIFGWLGDRMSRWVLVGIGVILWTLACGATGLATSFGMLLATRCFIGLGEAAYGPVAPTILSDLYPVAARGRVLSWFYMAIPVGSALGYMIGGPIAAALSWHWSFFVVVPPGLALGAWALFRRDPGRGKADGITESTRTPGRIPAAGHAGRPGTRLTLLKRLRRFWSVLLEAIQKTIAVLRVLLKTPSYVLDCLGMTAMTFAIGGIAFWMPRYIWEFRLHRQASIGTVNLVFGGLTVLGGLTGTLLGGMAGDALRKRTAGSYFIVSAAGLLVGFPMLLGVLYTPFPIAWGFVFLAVFCLFFNTGPSNAILANVTHPSMRSTAFALNILIIHALGDAISPTAIGWVSDRYNMNTGFMLVGLMFVIGGVFWLVGARYLGRDTELAPHRTGGARAGFPVVSPE
jgi:MFS transporter, Spinster family, sphingosine-1-phosphate transporter